MKKRDIEFVESVALLVGTVIGAGILSIPFVIAQSGIISGMLHLLILGGIVLLINLYVGEITLRTKKNHMLAGYAKKYIGKGGEFFMTLATLFGIYGALVAYMIGGGKILSSFFGGSSFIFSLIFLLFFIFLIYFKLDFVSRIELVLSFVMIALLILITSLTVPSFSLSNISLFNIDGLFLPYGVIFFAFLGLTTIPEMKAKLFDNKRRLKKAIIWGSMIVISIYFIFSLIIVGVTGANTTEIVTNGLGSLLGNNMIILGNLFALFSMSTSFLLLAFALKWMFYYDFDFSKRESWFLTWIVPLLVFLLGARSFIKVIGFTGAVAGGVQGILIVLIVMAAKKKSERQPEYIMPLNNLVAFVLILIFILGMLYEFFF